MIDAIIYYWTYFTGGSLGQPLLQLWVLITGSVCMIIVTNPDSTRHRAGCWIGLLGQPCWYYTTFQNAQWGCFVFQIITTASFINGILPHGIAGLFKEPTNG